uniref:Kinesin motor domain-containing protein n=1 Tax=Cucumis sativus TaxID=3659 RepID=A0A0A0LVY9_CUCSA
MVLDSKPSPAKLKSPLPPRSPSSNPLKRKVVVRLLPPSKDGDEGDNIIQKVMCR